MQYDSYSISTVLWLHAVRPEPITQSKVITFRYHVSPKSSELKYAMTASFASSFGPMAGCLKQDDVDRENSEEEDSGGVNRDSEESDWYKREVKKAVIRDELMENVLW